MRGKVEKVVEPVYPGQKEKAQIEVEDAEPLYRELRVDNEVVDENGHRSALEPGAKVDVIIEADKRHQKRNTASRNGESTPSQLS